MNKFYQLSIYLGHQETDEQLDVRYVNCLKFFIQDELSMHRVRNVEEAYRLALKVEEKQNRQFVQRIEEQGGVHHLPHVEALTLLKVYHPKSSRDSTK